MPRPHPHGEERRAEPKVVIVQSRQNRRRTAVSPPFQMSKRPCNLREIAGGEFFLGRKILQVFF